MVLDDIEDLVDSVLDLFEIAFETVFDAVDFAFDALFSVFGLRVAAAGAIRQKSWCPAGAEVVPLVATELTERDLVHAFPSAV